MLKRQWMSVVIIVSILCILLFSFLYVKELLPTRCAKLLSLSGIQAQESSKILLHVYWNDFLQYKTGYECLIIKTSLTIHSDWENGGYRLEDYCPTTLLVQSDKEKFSSIDLPQTFEYLKVINFSQTDEMWTLLYSSKGYLIIFRLHHQVHI